LPFCFYILSNASASELLEDLKSSMKTIDREARLFISEIPENSDGFITKESWYFITGPALAKQ